MDNTERITIDGYEYLNNNVPADRNFLSDLHGPDGMVSYADVLALLADRDIDRLLAERIEREHTRQISVEYACGGQEFWDLEPDGSLRIDIPRDRVVVSDCDLIEATREKFEKNRARSWTEQPDGTYQHT